MNRLPERRIAPFAARTGSPERRSAGALDAVEEVSSLEEMDLAAILREPDFQELAQLASEICEAPISLITLLDATTQWIMASVGTDLTETSREVAFCAHAIKAPDVFVVEDATRDERFRENPLVTGPTGIRFYAGFPLHQPEGEAFGTLCVIDTTPRVMTSRARTALAILGRQVQTRLELRAKRKKLERALEANERIASTLEETNQLFLTFMRHAPLASYIKDEQGRLVFYNRRLADQFGINEEEWIGQTDHDWFSEDTADKIRAADIAVLAGGVLSELVEQAPNPQGELTHWRSYKFPFRNRRGEMMLAGMSLDITDAVEREHTLAAQNEQLALLAGTDPLTGVPNRRAFEVQAAGAFGRASETRQPLSMLVLDIDDFKKRNDQLGHAAGDEALRQVGGLLRSLAVDGCVAARVGGEEFAVLLPGVTADAARAWGERVREGMKLLPCGALPLTASIGVASTVPGLKGGMARDWQRLMACADDAMYEGKRQGKDRVVAHQDLVQKLMNEAKPGEKPGKKQRDAAA